MSQRTELETAKHYHRRMDTNYHSEKTRSIQVRIMHEARLVLGDEHRLADYLRVRVELVSIWLKGKMTPPDHVFLRCVDLLPSYAV